MGKQLFYPEGWENSLKPINAYELQQAYETGSVINGLVRPKHKRDYSKRRSRSH